MNGRHVPITANERFKTTSRAWTRVGLLGAVAAHLALFLLVQPFQIDELDAAENGEMELVLPPEVDIPEPPAPVTPPSLPVVGDVELPPDATIDPNRWEDISPGALSPPRAAAPEADRRRFVPYDRAPRLANGEEARRLLERLYPSSLRAAGIGGRVELWLYVDETGAVTGAEVKTSSGETRLDEAALRVGESMRFEPAMNRDRPTAVWVARWISFSVR